MENQTNLYESRQFLAPPAYFYPGYFWIINDQITAERLQEQLREMVRKKAKSVCFLAEPYEFRPQTFNTRFNVAYLGETFFKLIQEAVAIGEECGMNWWLYDEGGWPSGGACGQVFSRNPEKLGKKKLIWRDFPLGADMAYPVEKELVAAAVKADGKWQVYRPGEIIPPPGCDTRLRIYWVVGTSDADAGMEGAPQPDPFCREATETFIRLTHERYRQYVGDSFGRTIRFTFTDEPSAAHPSAVSLPWTPGFEQLFAAEKGYRLESFLPLLSEPTADEPRAVTQARVDFFDVWSRLLVKNYFAPIKEWCHANNLLSCGHLGGDDEPEGNAKYGFGHILRALRGLDIPGVDVIWRQLFPGGRNHPFTKYASSVSRQSGMGLVMTENFAVYGNGLTPTQMKWITDQQYLQGANLMVMACYPYSTRHHLMAGERPHFGPVNPLWKYMDLFHEYTARLGYLLTRGRPRCRLAVYFDIRGIWAGGESCEMAVTLHDQISEMLLNAQCDFDFIDDDAIRDARVEAGVLQVGEMMYEQVILPSNSWLEEAAATQLKAFSHSGGALLKVGEVRGLADVGRKVELADLLTETAPLVMLDQPCEALRVCVRDCDDRRFYFLVNSEAQPRTRTVRFPESGRPLLCSVEEGTFRPLPYRSDPGASSFGAVMVELSFASYQSYMLVFGEAATEEPMGEPTGEETRRIPDECLALREGWRFTTLRSWRVGAEDFECVDLPNSPQLAELGDWRPMVGDFFSGDVCYSVEFAIDSKCLDSCVILDLGRVDYACEVILNGSTVGRRCWGPFRFDLGGRLREGTNRLNITVTNTLANALLHPAVEKEWYNRKEPGWPGGGHPYDQRQRIFERESLTGGLFGPVNLFFYTASGKNLEFLC